MRQLMHHMKEMQLNFVPLSPTETLEVTKFKILRVKFKLVSWFKKIKLLLFRFPPRIF